MGVCTCILAVSKMVACVHTTIHNQCKVADLRGALMWFVNSPLMVCTHTHTYATQAVWLACGVLLERARPAMATTPPEKQLDRQETQDLPTRKEIPRTTREQLQK